MIKRTASCRKEGEKTRRCYFFFLKRALFTIAFPQFFLWMIREITDRDWRPFCTRDTNLYAVYYIFCKSLRMKDHKSNSVKKKEKEEDDARASDSTVEISTKFSARFLCQECNIYENKAQSAKCKEYPLHLCTLRVFYLPPRPCVKIYHSRRLIVAQYQT